MNEDRYEMNIGGDDRTLTLAELAGVDMTEVIAEFSGGFSVTPEGVFEWRITSALLEPLEWDSKRKDAAPGERDSSITAVFNLECIACRRVKDDATDPTELAGIEHSERFFLKDFVRDMGNLKAFMQAAGMEGQGALSDLLDRAVGIEFVAAIKHRKDRNDPDRIFSNLDMDTVSALAAAQPEAVTPIAAVSAPAPVPLGGLGITA